MPANVENSAVATGLEKVSLHSNPKERQCQRMLKLLHNCTHLTLISHLITSKVMLKILQARLHQYVNRELPVIQAGFRKSRGKLRRQRGSQTDRDTALLHSTDSMHSILSAALSQHHLLGFEIAPQGFHHLH